MVKFVEFKDRAIERLEGYRENAKALPALTYARYARNPNQFKGGRNTKAKNANDIAGHFAKRNHKPHQMHTQHRESCVNILQLLIKRMDMLTRQCVYVNPKYNIRRSLYVPEIARITELCERTVTRALASLCKASYVIRRGMNYFLTANLIRDLNLELTYKRILTQQAGLAKRSAAAKLGNLPKIAQHSPYKNIIPNDKPNTVVTMLEKPTEASLAIGNQFLASLRPSRRKPPPE